MQQATLGQPKGLSIFFLTEMWERYGFYIIESLLVLYLIQKFTLSDDTSYAILGSFTALAYITPILGGYLADNVLGHRQGVLAGGALLCIGYSLMAMANSSITMSLALGIITMGTGLLKPNVSSLLGNLYTPTDSRRDSGFTLFYVGINMGILLATCSGGYLVELIGWHNTFATAAVGLVLGTAVFYFGMQYYVFKDFSPMSKSPVRIASAYFSIVLAALLSAYIIQHETFALLCFLAVSIGTIVLVLYKAFQFPEKERNKILAFLILVLISIIFWAAYFQLFFSLDLFVLRVVNHNLLGLYVPNSVFMGIEAFGVIAFGLVLGWFWTWLKNHSLDISTSMKFTMAMGLITLAFGVLLLSLKITPQGQEVASAWLILAYLLIAIAELALSPIGLAMVTELVPQSLVGMMMGIWFVSLGIGGKLAGLFADYSNIPFNMHQLSTIADVYKSAFSLYFSICLAASLLVWMVAPFITRLVKTL
ncbi:MAG: peptide MFS transporter [Gammaproteobacteria bacterium]|nr:peptide MFS transporter [Gammaproteobacteria bacterium]